MERMQSGYWDFYEDEAGRWHWRFACTEFKEVIVSEKGYGSAGECLRDAMKHGYDGSSDYRVTRSLAA